MFSKAPLLSKRLFATGFAVILAVASFAGVNADDGSTYEAKTWKYYHWDWNSAQQPLGFKLSIGTNFSDKYTDVKDWNVLLSSWVAPDWDASETLELSVGVPSLNDPKKCPPTLGRIEVCSENYGGRYVGLAQVWISGGHITQAITKLNERFLDPQGAYYDTYGTPQYRQMVLCQELGHDFGVDHSDTDFWNDNSGSCMDYTANPLGPPPNMWACPGSVDGYGLGSQALCCSCLLS